MNVSIGQDSIEKRINIPRPAASWSSRAEATIAVAENFMIKD
jgi:hypothetical protein